MMIFTVTARAKRDNGKFPKQAGYIKHISFSTISAYLRSQFTHHPNILEFKVSSPVSHNAVYIRRPLGMQS